MCLFPPVGHIQTQMCSLIVLVDISMREVTEVVIIKKQGFLLREGDNGRRSADGRLVHRGRQPSLVYWRIVSFYCVSMLISLDPKYNIASDGVIGMIHSGA